MDARAFHCKVHDWSVNLHVFEMLMWSSGCMHGMKGWPTTSADMGVAACVCAGEADKDSVQKQLAELGFSQGMMDGPVASLSGGWKMKLALGRAMLYRAQIMLLDEPTNHLDVNNVAWLENYLIGLKDVTSVIVSHDSGFLDHVCQSIIHYELNRKLRIYIVSSTPLPLPLSRPPVRKSLPFMVLLAVLQHCSRLIAVWHVLTAGICTVLKTKSQVPDSYAAPWK